MTGRSTAGGTPISRIDNVTAFVGDGYEPLIVTIDIDDTGVISAITAAEDTERQRRAAGVIDGTGLMAFPGMVDCHDHLRNLTPGLSIGEGLKLDEFLRVMWRLGAGMGPTEYELGATLGCLQRLKTGITTVADHCYTYHADGLDEAAVRGYEATGARWSYARGLMTRPYAPVCETWEVAERRIRHLVENGTVAPEQLFIAPVSIRQATPEEFRKCVALADEVGCGVYTHASETAAEQQTWQDECGTTPIRALDEFGFLTPRTVLVHCVVLDDGEIELLAERGTHVIHCPTNHMKLAKGFTRVPDLLAAGVNVGLGIDMMADMLVEMRTELGMHAAHRLDPNAVTKSQVLHMATHGGAKALGFGDRRGVLSEGRDADIVLLDTRNLLQAPLVDPTYALLYATHAGMVTDVLVGGRRVIEDGRSTIIDEAALVAEAHSIVSAYLRRMGMEAELWPLGGPADR